VIPQTSRLGDTVNRIQVWGPGRPGWTSDKPHLGLLSPLWKEHSPQIPKLTGHQENSRRPGLGVILSTLSPMKARCMTPQHILIMQPWAHSRCSVSADWMMLISVWFRNCFKFPRTVIVWWTDTVYHMSLCPCHSIFWHSPSCHLVPLLHQFPPVPPLSCCCALPS
jgi:hypothetical protein